MGDDTYTVLTNAEGRQIGGAMNPPMEGVPPHWNVYFNVEDVDATVAKTRRARRPRSWRRRSTCRASAGWPCSPTLRARCST